MTTQTEITKKDHRRAVRFFWAVLMTTVGLARQHRSRRADVPCARRGANWCRDCNWQTRGIEGVRIVRIRSSN
jgi:hypothetical protein